MPSASEIYKSGDWLSASNDGTISGIDGSPRTVDLTISKTSLHEWDDGRKQIVLDFHEIEARYGVGSMAKDELIDHIDDDYDLWVGHRVRLTTMRIPSGKYKGKTHMIGLQVLKGEAAAAPAPAAAAPPPPAAAAPPPPLVTGEHLFGDAYAAALSSRLADIERTEVELRAVLIEGGVPQEMVAGGMATWPKALVDHCKAGLEKLKNTAAAASVTEDDIPF